MEELLATPADSSYEIAFARVQVAAPSQLTLRTVSGDNQVPGADGSLPAPIVVRLTDVNGLPYPGARIQAAATGGSVTPAIAVADATGQASFKWSPGTGSANQLNLVAGRRVHRQPDVDRRQRGAGDFERGECRVVCGGSGARLAGHALRRQSGRRHRVVERRGRAAILRERYTGQLLCAGGNSARSERPHGDPTVRLKGLGHDQPGVRRSPAFSAARWCTPERW